MALPLPQGLTPPEVAFLCEMELVTIIPRQRLESVQLLGGATPTLRPPARADVPLWLALLLKRQHRADILPPPWLNPITLERVLKHETEISPSTFSPPLPFPAITTAYPPYSSPPFIPHSTTTTQSTTASPETLSLPYHWLELSEAILSAISDTLPTASHIRTLLRDIREVRVSKMRALVKELTGGGGVFILKGVGAMEVCEGRGFIVGVMDGMRKIGASKEAERRQREEEDGGDSEDEMEL